MRIKALVTFCGVISMYAGEVREVIEVSDNLRHLLDIGYIEEIETLTRRKTDEGKRNKS